MKKSPGTSRGVSLNKETPPTVTQSPLASQGTLRFIKGVAWAWQDKRALRLIRESFDEARTICPAMTVYLVMTEFASDEQAEIFTRRKAEIAQRAGLSLRKVADLINQLAGIGLLKVITNHIPGTKLKAPNTYQLLSIGTPCTSIGTVAGQANLPRVQNNLLKESEKNASKEIDVGETDLEAQALQIYELYPQKVGKPAALKAILKALEVFGFNHLADKTKAYAAARAGDKAFVPNPKTWFSEERFNDDPSTWKRNENSKPLSQSNYRNSGIAANSAEVGERIAARVASKS